MIIVTTVVAHMYQVMVIHMVAHIFLIMVTLEWLLKQDRHPRVSLVSALPLMGQKHYFLVLVIPFVQIILVVVPLIILDIKLDFQRPRRATEVH